MLQSKFLYRFDRGGKWPGDSSHADKFAINGNRQDKFRHHFTLTHMWLRHNNLARIAIGEILHRTFVQHAL